MPRKKKSNRKDGMFVKSFTFNGKRYYVYGSTEDEALEKRAAKKKQLEEGIEEMKHPTSIMNTSQRYAAAKSKKAPSVHSAFSSIMLHP